MASPPTMQCDVVCVAWNSKEQSEIALMCEGENQRLSLLRPPHHSGTRLMSSILSDTWINPLQKSNFPLPSGSALLTGRVTTPG